MTNTLSTQKGQSGFTLIELLVVIAIIAILAAILFPVFAKAREKARQTQCTNNQKQIAQAFMLYTQENDDKLPAAFTTDANSNGQYDSGDSVAWMNAINVSGKVLHCPSRPKNTSSTSDYAYNSALSGLSLGDINEATGVVLTIDSDTPAGTFCHMAPHTGKQIAAYVDGHVELTYDQGPWYTQFQVGLHGVNDLNASGSYGYSAPTTPNGLVLSTMDGPGQRDALNIYANGGQNRNLSYSSSSPLCREAQQNVSVGFWLYLKGTYTNNPIVYNQSRDNCSGWGFSCNNDLLSAMTCVKGGSGTGEAANATYQFPENEWHHVLAVFRFWMTGNPATQGNEQTTLYIDGKQVAQVWRYCNGALGGINPYTGPIYLGGSFTWSVPSTPANSCSLSDVRVYNRVLTADEITAISANK